MILKRPVSKISASVSKFFTLCLLLLSLCVSSNAYAMHPLISDDAWTTGTGKFNLELNAEYANDNGDTETQLAATLTAGVRENIDLVATVPYLFTRIDEGAETLREDGLSDITLELKWRFYEKEGLGIALKPGISIPTGDKDKGLGDGEASYSLHLLTSKEVNPVTLHLDLGYTRNGREFRDIWHCSLAAEYPVSKPLTLVADIGGETNPDRDSNVAPVFVLGGMVYKINENFSVDLGLKTGLTKSEADYTVLAGVIIDF
ncbi:MAG TPA: transporter [Thermodesulfovibrionales bacterium]|nr:transporter [Thermodesulfovibrionales bacterium]